MNLSFYKGGEGKGYWSLGALNDVDRVAISVKNRFGDKLWASIENDPIKGVVFKIENSAYFNHSATQQTKEEEK